MALVECLECGKQISDQAAACPSCGAPVRPAIDKPGVVTTQQTGKKYKVLQFVGFAMLAGGVVACTQKADEVMIPLFLLGAILYAAGRVGAWWRHG